MATKKPTKTSRILVRLTDAQRAKLDRIATKKRWSLNATIGNLIDDQRE